MIPCAENHEIAEIPGKKLVDDLFHLLASYYILFKISWMLLLLFPTCSVLQTFSPAFYACDILMGKPETHGPTKNRPTRYKTFISRL